jgi:hypothetical protein
MKALLVLSIIGVLSVGIAGCTNAGAIPSATGQASRHMPARAHDAACPVDTGGAMTGDTGC